MEHLGLPDWCVEDDMVDDLFPLSAAPLAATFFSEQPGDGSRASDDPSPQGETRSPVAPRLPSLDAHLVALFGLPVSMGPVHNSSMTLPSTEDDALRALADSHGATSEEWSTFFSTLGLGTLQGVADLSALLSKCPLVVPESFEFASSPLFTVEAGRWAVSQSFLSALVAANGGKPVDPKTLDLLPRVIRRCTKQGRLNIRPPLWGSPPASYVRSTNVSLVLGAIESTSAGKTTDLSSPRRSSPSTSTAAAAPAGTSSDGAQPGGATAAVTGGGRTGDDSMINELAARAAAAAATMALDDMGQDEPPPGKDVIPPPSARSGASGSCVEDGAFADSLTVVSVADGLLPRLPVHISLSMAAAAALSSLEPGKAVPPPLAVSNASGARNESDPSRRQELSTAADDAARCQELPGGSQPPPQGNVVDGLLPRLPPGIFLGQAASGGVRAVPGVPDSGNQRAVPLPVTTKATTAPSSSNDACTTTGQPPSSLIPDSGSPSAALLSVAGAAPGTAPTTGTGSSLAVPAAVTASGVGNWGMFSPGPSLAIPPDAPSLTGALAGPQPPLLPAAAGGLLVPVGRAAPVPDCVVPAAASAVSPLPQVVVQPPQEQGRRLPRITTYRRLVVLADVLASTYSATDRKPTLSVDATMKLVNGRTSTFRPVVQRTMQKDIALWRRRFTQSNVADQADGQPKVHQILLDAAPPDVSSLPLGRHLWVTRVTAAMAADQACLDEPLPTVPSPRGSRITPMTADTWVTFILSWAMRHPEIAQAIVSSASSRAT